MNVVPFRGPTLRQRVVVHPHYDCTGDPSGRGVFDGYVLFQWWDQDHEPVALHGFVDDLEEAKAEAARLNRELAAGRSP